MGTYLSTPITDKNCEGGACVEGANPPVRWGVVDMQGWRKSMEDAHLAATNVQLNDLQCHVFGVFDGHGGAEVARFCQLYLLSVLQQQTYDSVGDCLVETFHALDRMIDDRNRVSEIVALRTNKPDHMENAPFIPPAQPIEDVPPPPDPTVQLEKEVCGERSIILREAKPLVDNDSEEQAQLEYEVDEEDDSKDDDADDDSQEAAGKEEAARLDQDMMNDADDEMEAPEQRSGKVGIMFHRLLNMSGQAASPRQRSASKPTLVHNGRLVCNLPDHPIHAGATAIVAVLSSDSIVVANAGDSRAVLCRKGRAMPLSIDHKPLDERERSRIQAAGGFVNQFGRVNGNLNLSRSIGDLKYKQVPGLDPRDQMITAQPDIFQLPLEPNDEFLILGCDGIWDCVTNDKAVEYVRSRLDSMAAYEIGAQLLDEILSVDPRVTQGIGGDNMTILIVDLQPHRRSYHHSGSNEFIPIDEAPTKDGVPEDSIDSSTE